MGVPTVWIGKSPFDNAGVAQVTLGRNAGYVISWVWKALGSGVRVAQQSQHYRIRYRSLMLDVPPA